MDQFQGILRIAIAGLVTYAANKGWIPMIDKDALSADLISIGTIAATAYWSNSHVKQLISVQPK